MGSVDCFQLKGLDIWFNSDDHLPPHFHVEKSGEWEVRVFFLRDSSERLEAKWYRKSGPSAAICKRIARVVEANRENLMEEWSRKVNVKTPGAKR